MMTGKDPGELGIYGFRNRRDHSYNNLAIANAGAIKEPTVWDFCAEHNKHVGLLGIPQTYPPRPVNGWMVTSFLTPSTKSQYTYPPALRQEIEELVGEYMLDVEGFRTEDKDRLLRQIYEMTDQRFALARHFIREKPWDFFMMVEMGPDRIHHGFWKYGNPDHPLYEAGNPYENAIHDYYVHVDERIGELLELIDDRTVVLVVSDHGAQTMHGGICVNEWLIEKGYLNVLGAADSGQQTAERRTAVPSPSSPRPLIPLSDCEIDWENTRAWGEGGYYARIFLNVQGREPRGMIPPNEYEAFRDQLAAELEALGDEHGNPIGTKVYKPEDVYREVKNIPPDLIVYFGNLSWRSVGSLGHGSAWTHENDTGPDDANHAQHGLLIIDPRRTGLTPTLRAPSGVTHAGADSSATLSATDLLDIAPTILHALRIPVPEGIGGRVLFS
jgi:predicted AlkP superfamily phosphohydrolase/phosphomutase